MKCPNSDNPDTDFAITLFFNLPLLHFLNLIRYIWKEMSLKLSSFFFKRNLNSSLVAALFIQAKPSNLPLTSSLQHHI